MSIHKTCRRTARLNVRRPLRKLNRAGVRGRRRGPDDFAQALTAFRRAIRAHRRLARLAPSFFDAAVVERERENRAEQRRWMALWEPVLAKVYGVDPEPLPADTPPPLPPPRIQRAVDRELPELQLWLAAGHLALARYQQRNPHALLSWTRMARCLNLAFDLKKMVLGLDSPNPLPDKITYDYEFTDLKRAYGHPEAPPVPAASGETMARGAATVPDLVLPVAPVGPPTVVIGGAIASGAATVPASRPASSCAAQPPTTLPAAPPGASPEGPRRCDAWSRWARHLRMRSG